MTILTTYCMVGMFGRVDVSQIAELKFWAKKLS